MRSHRLDEHACGTFTRQREQRDALGVVHNFVVLHVFKSDQRRVWQRVGHDQRRKDFQYHHDVDRR